MNERFPKKLGGLIAALLLACGMLSWSLAQENGENAVGPTPEPIAAQGAGNVPIELPSSNTPSINFFDLLISGGGFMIPILGMSILGVTMTIERAINLRRGRIMPPGLITALGQLGASSGGFDPRKAYRICQQFPSTAATVIRAMLLKIGRPHSEVEHAVAETCQREGSRLYSNVRWLNLVVAVTPLIGLLGTVWGMIICFHDMTYLEGVDSTQRAAALSGGIYVALVTTLGGLMVAIPIAIIAHFFEGRILNLMGQVEELVFNLLPQVERFEGRVRFTRHQGEGEGDSPRNGELAAEEPRTAGAK